MKEPNAVDDFIRLNPKTQMFEPVWWRREILPYALYPDEQFFTGAQAIAAAPNATPPFIYKLPHASVEGMDGGLGNPLLIDQLVFEDSTDTTGSAAFTIFVKDMGDRTQFMNAPIHIRTFAGGLKGGEMLPARLAEPLFLPTRHNLLVTFNKISGGAVNARTFFWGKMFFTWATNLQKYPADWQMLQTIVNKYLERRKYVYPFYLTTENGVVTVPGNQMVEVDSDIGDDGHFDASHILAISDGTFQVELFNPQTRQTLMNGTIHSAFIGDAFNPQPFPASFIVPRGETLRWRITDLSGSSNKVFLTLRGRKINAPMKNIADVQADLAIDPLEAAATADAASMPLMPQLETAGAQ